MLYRIGVNVGDVVIDGGSLYGDGVNVAARLEALAEPGGICVSGAVFDQVRGKVDLAFEPLGRKSLKNIALPVNVYRVPLNGRSRRFLARWLAGCDWRRRRFGIVVAAIMVASVSSCWMFESNDPPGSGRSTVAVLPWRATSPDETTAKLADGLTESIVVALTRNGQAEVVASSLTADYKGKLVKARDVGSALNVGYVIEGTIRREDGKVRISAQLIDASTEVILWSDSWERTLEDPFTMQTEIADQLASSIRRAL